MDNAVLNDLYENAYEVYYFDHSSKKVGKTDSAALYGLPKDQGPYALCYNEDLLTKAANAYNATAAEKDKIDLGRVTDPKNPMTFSDFIDLGKKLKTQLKTARKQNTYVPVTIWKARFTRITPTSSPTTAAEPRLSIRITS